MIGIGGGPRYLLIGEHSIIPRGSNEGRTLWIVEGILLTCVQFAEASKTKAS
jgi:hypothetical protein